MIAGIGTFMTGQKVFSRILFAFLVGASLSLAGAVFQVLLKNELATPYTLGISSGGALGAVLAIKLGLVIQLMAFSSTVLFSVLGSLLTIGIIYFIARERHEISTFTLLLAGVTLSLFFSSLILFIHYLADFTETYRMIRWLMGALDVVGWQYPLSIFFLLIPAFAYLFYHAMTRYREQGYRRFDLLGAMMPSIRSDSRGRKLGRLLKPRYHFAVCSWLRQSIPPR